MQQQLWNLCAPRLPVSLQTSAASAPCRTPLSARTLRASLALHRPRQTHNRFDYVI